MPITLLRSAASESTIKTVAGDIRVITSGYIPSDRPVVLQFGPLLVSLNYAEAIDFGDEVIRAVHHHQAALAEYRQACAEAIFGDSVVPA